MHEHSIPRLMAHVDKRENGCWQWTGSLNPGGYGVFGIYGRHTVAHRVTYEMFKGPIPDGLTIDHLCRHPGCVNPDHLEAVTMAENILRSEGVGAKNARKTHCPRGHEYTPENTFRGKKSLYRRCRRCVREGWFTSESRRARMEEHARLRALRGDCCPNGHLYPPDVAITKRGRRCMICFEANKRRAIASSQAKQDMAWRVAHGLAADTPLTYRDKVLAGNNFTAVHAKATHCPKGHPYSEENTRVERGRRHCRECHKLNERERRARLKAGNVA